MVAIIHYLTLIAVHPWMGCWQHELVTVIPSSEPPKVIATDRWPPRPPPAIITVLGLESEFYPQKNFFGKPVLPGSHMITYTAQMPS